LLLLLELEPPPPPFCCGALAEDFFDDFFFEDFFFLVFFFFVFFVAFFAGAAGFSTAFGAALAAGFRAPGSRNFGEVIDPGTDPELDVHGGPPIMPHACASLISLFAEVVRTSTQAITLSTSTRPHIPKIFIPDHPAIAHTCDKRKRPRRIHRSTKESGKFACSPQRLCIRRFGNASITAHLFPILRLTLSEQQWNFCQRSDQASRHLQYLSPAMT
jgi:hypothetical protein